MNLVQPILVYPCIPRNVLLHDVAHASVSAMLTLEGYWDQWLANSYTKTVRKISSVEKLKRMNKELNLASWNYASAYTPLTYESFPKAIAKAQVSHWEDKVLANDDSAQKSKADYQILINAEFNMSPGKAAAQAAHALMSLYLEKEITMMERIKVNSIEQKFESHHYEQSLLMIKDNGLTEVETGSLTALVMVD